MDFIQFKQAVAKQFDRMRKHDLFVTQVEKDDLWATYLNSFPEGTNPVYRERTEHDCSCCRQFIRAVGNVVAIIDGVMVSIWDIEGPVHPAYRTVADALSALVHSKPIDNFFLTTERTAGQDKNFEQMVDRVQTWEHFFVNIPSQFVMRGEQIGLKLSDLRATHDVFLRGLQEIDQSAVETVLELIGQNSLYWGEEHRHTLTEFQKIQQYAHDVVTNWDLFVWDNVNKVSPAISRIRNTSIGTLLQDLSSGVDLEDAVKKFEAMVAPANYKRPTALVSKAMVEKARAKIEELGLTSALERRYAKLTDITVNNVLFADRDAKKAMGGDVFDDIAGGIREKADRVSAKVEDVPIDRFLSEVLPRATSLEVLFENSHAPNLVSLIAPVDPTAGSLFKWGNSFSWSYNGDMADSIKERVKAAGGNVTGELCCRLAWEYADDLDFHMMEPHSSHIYFSNRGRLSTNGGMLDVDANGMDGIKEHPVENIFYDRLATMKDGTYTLAVNNYSRRSDGTGFEVEIDIKGVVHHFVYEKAIRSGEYVEVAKLKKTKEGIEVIPLLPSTQASKQVWNIPTQTYRRVSAVMLSPNYWDEQGVGNKHYFFMLDGCQNDGKARGFFNEFLKPELNEHRKVFEIVGSKMKTAESADQMSGLGFSSTQRNNLLVRVQGAFTRVINVVF